MVEELRLILPNGVEWFCGNDRFRNRGSQSGCDSLLACLFLEVRGNLPLISPQWGKIEAATMAFGSIAATRSWVLPRTLPGRGKSGLLERFSGKGEPKCFQIHFAEESSGAQF